MFTHFYVFLHAWNVNQKINKVGFSLQKNKRMENLKTFSTPFETRTEYFLAGPVYMPRGRWCYFQRLPIQFSLDDSPVLHGFGLWLVEMECLHSVCDHLQRFSHRIAQ